jgi:hypothetical protein
MPAISGTHGQPSVFVHWRRLIGCDLESNSDSCANADPVADLHCERLHQQEGLFFIQINDV